MNSNKDTAIKTVYFSLLSNASLALIKGIAGIFGNSYALIADAIESTTDIFSSLLVLFGIKYANKPADEDHPYGHGKAEPLITFLVVGLLILSAVVIAIESIDNIKNPHELPKPWTLIVLGIIIIWKEASYQIVMRKSKLINSSSLKADAWHHRSDALTSVTAFIGICFALYMGPGFEAADDWAALVASAFIIYNSYKIFMPALSEVMDEDNFHELENKIRKLSLEVKGVEGTEKCYIRKSGMQYHVELHALVNENLSVRVGHEIAHELKDELQLKIPQLGYVIIHIEPYTNTI